MDQVHHKVLWGSMFSVTGLCLSLISVSLLMAESLAGSHFRRNYAVGSCVSFHEVDAQLFKVPLTYMFFP